MANQTAHYIVIPIV